MKSAVVDAAEFAVAVVDFDTAQPAASLVVEAAVAEGLVVVGRIVVERTAAVERIVVEQATTVVRDQVVQRA